MRLIDADKLKVYRCDDSASRATFDYIYEDDVEDAPTIDLVRCGECKWYEPRHIEENGIECAGQCIWHIGLKTYCDAHDRENPEDRPRMIIFREPTDFCSYGERRADGDI